MKNYKQLWITVPFVIVIFGTGILNMLSKDKTESLTENRVLQQRPGLENIISKDYPSLYESYYTDQFIKRDQLLKLYTKFEILTKKSNIRGYYINNENWILPGPVAKQTNEQTKSYADKLNNFCKKIEVLERKVFYVSTPCKSQALNHLYSKYVDRGYVLENLKNFSNNLCNIEFIGLDQYFTDKFSPYEKEKMYFKTDHHWNEIGAFEGFKYIVKEMNILDKNKETFISNDNFTTYELKNREFIGSYNRNLFYLFSKDENVPYVNSKNRKNYKFFNYNGKEYIPTEEDVLISPERKFKQITYGGAYTYDNALYKIVNDKAPINKKILIVRDSYQAPTTLLFADLFKEVEILDPRNNIDVTVSKTVNQGNPDIVMFMFNSETYGNMINLIK